MAATLAAPAARLAATPLAHGLTPTEHVALVPHPPAIFTGISTAPDDFFAGRTGRRSGGHDGPGGGAPANHPAAGAGTPSGPSASSGPGTGFGDGAGAGRGAGAAGVDDLARTAGTGTGPKSRAPSGGGAAGPNGRAPHGPASNPPGPGPHDPAPGDSGRARGPAAGPGGSRTSFGGGGADPLFGGPSGGGNGLSPVIVTGPDAGAPPLVKVFDAATGQEKFEFLAYPASFLGGVRVAAADLTGDGIPDIITAPGPGMAPEVKAFDGTTGAQLSGPVGDFLAYGNSFQGGVFVAAADTNEDGVPDIVTGPGAGGGSQVRSFSGTDATLLGAFSAYGPGYQAGVPVAAGFWQGMGHARILTGTGPGVVAEVRLFDGQTGAQVSGPLGDLFPYGHAFFGGVWVAAGDVNGDGKSDIITGAGLGHSPEVKAFSGTNAALLQDLAAGNPLNRAGVRVASTYIVNDTNSDLVTAGGPGALPRVNNYSGASGQPLPPPADGFLAYDATMLSGVFVAAAIDPSVTAAITPNSQTIITGGSATVTVSWSTTLPNPWGGASYISWGDGSAFTNFVPGSFPGSFTASHTYSTPGTYAVHAQVQINSTGGGGAVPADGQVIVTGAPKAYVPVDDCGCSGSGTSLTKSAAGLGGPAIPMYSGDTGVRYADGAVKLGWTDLSSAGFGTPWGQARSWSSGAGYAAGGSNGNGWVDSQSPHLLRADGTSDNSLALVNNATTVRYFDLSGGTYQPRFFDQSQLAHNTGTQEFVLTDTNGNQLHFADFSSGISAAQRGALKSFVDPDGNTTSVTSWTSSGLPAEVQRSVGSGGTAVIESYLYSYLASDPGSGLLQNVTLRRSTDGGSTWSTVRQVAYSYYDGSTSNGTRGDLKTAVVKDAAGNALDTSYFRYYTTSNGTGYAGGLKYAFGPQSYARLVAALGSGVDALTDTQIAPYADDYFEYGSNQRVTKATVQGAGCSDCSGGLGTFTYAYTTSSNTAGMNSWAMKTVETLPDGNTNTVYTNAYGEVMLLAFTDTAASQTWGTFYKYDSQGHVALQANPSAVTGYSDLYADLLHSTSGNYQYLSDSAGLVQVYDFYSTTTASSSTAGGVAGYQQDTKLQQGETGTAILQGQAQYFQQTAGGATVNPLATSTVYRNTDGTGAETTSYAYTWFSGTTQVQSLAVSAPVVSSSQNGPGTADVTTTFYDAYARPIWRKDADGFISYTAYDQATGAVVKTISDVDTTQTSDFSGLPSGWGTPTGGGLHLKTLIDVDSLGRTTKLTDANGNITYTVFIDTNYEARTYPGWNSSISAPTGPTQVTREDRPGSYTEALTMSATPHLTGGVPDGTEAVSGVQTLSRRLTNAAGQVVETDQYFNLSGVTYSTTAHLGTAGTNYYATLYGYDDRGRPDRVLAPTGTIDRTAYDGLGRVVSTWVGTNDTPASGEWSPSNNTSPANMVQVTGSIYDGGGVGDSNLTQETQYPGGSAANRVTNNYYDWRDRPVASKAGVQASEDTTTHRPIAFTTYDNLNEVTQSQQYDGDGVTITTSGGVPQAPSSGLLRAQTATSYDDQGRVYQSQTYSVNPATGAVSSSALTTNTWYDHRGDAIKTAQPGGLVSKTAYDGAGRATVVYTTDGGGDSTWADAGNVTGDAVLMQVETTYDSAGNVLLTTTRERFHDETAAGALGNPTTSPKARVSYAASYYDLANRLTDTANVGTNGGSAYTRPSSVPARSDTVLVTSYAYTAAGFLDTTTDPRGIVAKNYYDNLGRVTKAVQAYDGGAETNSTNVATEYTYDGNGHTLTVQADLPGGAYQRTQYVYGVTTATGSGITSNDILAAIQYPDPTTGNPSSSQQETVTVNALGQTKTKADRNGSVHTYSYDVLGRQTADAVTTLGSGVDGAVRRIAVAYDTQGNPYLITSYDAASAGNVVNQVQRGFNGLRQLVTEYQSHSGAVNTSTTPEVQYAYSEMSGGANHSRLTSITYPDGRALNYNYSTGLDSSISRLSSLSDSSGTLESYSYLGLGTVVIRSHPQPGIDLTYVKQTGESNGDAGDQYAGLDRFGRVADQRWIITSSGTATDRFQYGYDRDGNVLFKNNLVNGAFSELYHVNGAGNGYDSLNQLTAFARGTLNGSNDTITSPSHSQSWSLDAVGNWSSVTTDGSTQTRTANAQNEITSLSGQTTPTYDGNGNTTTDQSGNTLVYDAWNRLVAYKSGSTTLETMAYDGLNRRIVTSTGTAADLYYSKDWQVLEERSDGTTTAQYVWSPVYVDALVERDRGSERLYAQQDANWNTTAMVDNTGTVQERNVYDPYGQVTVLTPSWGSRGTSAYAWIYLHQGGRFDGVMGLYYFRQRDYSPGLGRWMQQDPVALLAGDNNLYRGEDDSPVTRVDPLGLSTQWKPGVWPSARQFYINWYNGCPREDFEIFWKGCVGLASLRCGLQGKFPTLAEGVRCFKKQSVAEDELKKLKCEKWQRPMMFAGQFNAYKKPETERNFGNPDEIDPLSIDPGSGYNFATWHDLDGETQYWEWMWGSFVCDERKGDSVPIHHDKNLPGEGPGEARKYKEKAFCIMCANKCSWTVPRINKDTGAYEFPENPPKK